MCERFRISSFRNPKFPIGILGFFSEILGFSFEILGLSKICDDRIP